MPFLVSVEPLALEQIIQQCYFVIETFCSTSKVRLSKFCEFAQLEFTWLFTGVVLEQWLCLWSDTIDYMRNLIISSVGAGMVMLLQSQM